jgi:hypothetical protein
MAVSSEILIKGIYMVSSLIVGSISFASELLIPFLNSQRPFFWQVDFC